jgi:tetratricopeptide (TPR) repeat protein
MNISKTFLAALALAIGGPSTALVAQSPRAFEQAADAAFEARDYYAAFKYYGNVLQIEPTRTDIAVRYADAARLYGAYRDAEQHYEAALATENAGSKYHTALFGLAVVKKHLGKYDEALRLFERYAARPDSDPELRRKATGEMVECEWALEKITNPDVNMVLEPLEGAYNTGDSEMGAVHRGDTTYFSALRPIEWGDKHYPTRPLLQVMQVVGQQAAVPAAFNHPTRHTALPAFSPDGRLMVVPMGQYVGETDVRCQLFFSQKNTVTGQWSAPVALPATVNAPNATATQPHIAARPDGYFDLYYISDAPGGKGGKDIWQVQFSATGNFGQPTNLVALNTEADEATPHFDARTNSLYFSSLGYQNLGGYDVYKAFFDNKTAQWSAVKHLPVPLNSGYNDLYFAPQTEDLAFLTSNRIGAATSGEESCCYDLFQAKFLPIGLEASAFEEATKEPLNEVVFSLLPEDEPALTKYSATANKADFKVKRERTYVVMASKEGYFPDTARVSLANLEPNTRLLREKLYLQPMKVDLAVAVFDDLSKEPIYGVNVRLFERSGRVREERNTGTKANGSDLKADYRQGYVIIAEKEGYAPDTTEVSVEEMSKPGTKVLKNLFLTPSSLYGLLPLAIYFDNDVPPRQPATRVESYDFTFENYMARRAEFIATFTQNMPSEAEKADATARLNRFFDEEVQGGMVKLEYLAENLDLFLSGGYSVEIMVKGFASPLASKEYNLALTKRRIVSVQNYLRKAKGGVYETFIQQKQLIVTTAPLGETMSKSGVSDSARQREQSVFSPEASFERRAEIIEVRLKRGGN